MPTFDNVDIQACVDIEFEVFCARCGAGLCGNSDTRSSYNRGCPQVTVEPCDKCISNSKDEGYDEGYEKGQQDAKEEFSNDN